MKLTVLGSNSSGNCYIIQNETEALILECGIRFSEVQKALNFNLKKVVAAFVTHEHGDHAKYITEFISRNIPIFASSGTLEAKKVKGNIIEHQKPVSVGNFRIIPFDVKHDCAEPMGFYISHPETGNILFATDTYYIPYVFPNIRHWMIECNYRKDILDRNCPEGFKRVLRDRTLQSHMSYETCIDALKSNDLSQTNTITLIHLSDSNSNASEFKEGVLKMFGKTTYIADKGLVINLNETPF